MNFGALVISLDFELHWGLSDGHPAGGRFSKRLLGRRELIPRLLDVFDEFGIAATWATVGFLFARSRAELFSLIPEIRPRYKDHRLLPYGEKIGLAEAEDPLHYAPSLIAEIRRHPHQEVGIHTFSHYYCLEPGQTRESFQADIAAAVRIAWEHSITLSSIVVPRNQHNPRLRRHPGGFGDTGISWATAGLIISAREKRAVLPEKSAQICNLFVGAFLWGAVGGCT